MAKPTNGATFEQQLFKVTDKLRKNIDAAEYKYVVPGLVFIKYISETFNEFYHKIKARWENENNVEVLMVYIDRTEDRTMFVFAPNTRRTHYLK